MAVSSGVLLFGADNQVLLGHPSGSGHWDIPKGTLEAGEDALSAASAPVSPDTTSRARADGHRGGGSIASSCPAWRLSSRRSPVPWLRPVADPRPRPPLDRAQLDPARDA